MLGIEHLRGGPVPQEKTIPEISSHPAEKTPSGKTFTRRALQTTKGLVKDFGWLPVSGSGLAGMVAAIAHEDASNISRRASAEVIISLAVTLGGMLLLHDNLPSEENSKPFAVKKDRSAKGIHRTLTYSRRSPNKPAA